MPDMDKAVKRLNRALGNKEKILIYGDYDVDGTTAVSLVYKYLRPYSSSLDYYIPDRYDEGYGISYKGIDYASDNGVSLIISLDCGIKAIEKIEYAKGKGIDFIICDHHMPDDTLPDAVAVLDAKRVDSIYPYEHLSGCGVGFKFMQAFAKSNNFPPGTERYHRHLRTDRKRYNHQRHRFQDRSSHQCVRTNDERKGSSRTVTGKGCGIGA